ncbi:MAG: NAD(P)/FAD-dependent oxidoreductase [Thermoanaerobaculaceae bacterium]|nr:NAD(P)/FAD-dependent oxidoreductase [Thermoanaerobaculaceae bacterium]
MQRIVILGGGFAGATCAQRLDRRVGSTDVEVVLINRTNYFVFTPLLVEAGTGALEPRHVVVPLRDFLPNATLRTAEVEDVDRVRRVVRYTLVGDTHQQEMPYDHLVVALGSITRLPPVPGLATYGFGMKSLWDAVALRDRAIELLERADATGNEARRRALLHLVVVGGNFTGVEVAGEFSEFLRAASRAYRNVASADCHVTLIEAAPRILSSLDEDLADYAQATLRNRGISVRLGTTVTSVEREFATLATGERLGTCTVIWCAGIAPNPLLGRLGLPTDAQGWLLCESDLRVVGEDAVWGIGDCAVNPDPSGRPYPATAQHAVRQAEVLADNLLRALRREPLRACVIRSPGALAALGCRSAVAKVFGIKLSGFAAWFLWRTVYLSKMPGWARRIRVAIDWTLALLFRRPTVQLGVHRKALEVTSP